MMILIKKPTLQKHHAEFGKKKADHILLDMVCFMLYTETT